MKITYLSFFTSLFLISFRLRAHERFCGDTSSRLCVAGMWLLIGFHCLDVSRAHECLWRVTGRLLLIPVTAWYGCVSRTRAHERLWLTDRHVASSSESMLKLRPCRAWQSGVALPIHTGDSVPWLSQDRHA